MANAAGPGGGGGGGDPAPNLPKLTTRVLQLIDGGHSVWDAFFTGVSEHVAALAKAIGSEFIIDVGDIEK